MNIRTKLIVMLAVPIAALAIVAIVGFRSQNIDSDANDTAAAWTETLVTLDGLWLDIAEERIAVLGNATNAQSQALIEETNATIDAIEVSGDVAAWDVAAEVELQLPLIRNASLVSPAEQSAAETVLDQYEEALIAIEEGIDQIPLDGFSADSVLVTSGLQSARLSARETETAWLRFANTENDVQSTEAREFTQEWSIAGTVGDIAEGLELTNGEQPFADAAQSSANNDLRQVEAVAINAFASADGGVLTADEVEATRNAVAGIDVVDTLEDSRDEWEASSLAAQTFLRDDIAAAQSDISSARSLTTLLALLGGLLLFSLLFVIGRSILGPLGRLMENADVMTHERLPAAVAQLRSVGASDEEVTLAPIPKETNDEIGTIVEAFNDMQSSALKVATDQAKSRRNVAEMFVSLGRRNQQLNHRMITMISDLERDEQDPETLRGLYQLDHLATRMRRNAESLLVLAGNRSPRQWSKPVPFDDVVRSSLAEVEYFERIEIGDLPDVAMSGAVVTDITHMLAELLDNATQFSDPTTIVNISATETHTSVEMEISDNGFGINPQDLAVFNERVTNPPALDEAPSRLLGLFVVGRLAVQHEVYVNLQSESGEGTTVTISIPKTHFPVEAGENPIDTTPAADAVNSDNASDFFGSSNADVAPPVLTDIGGAEEPQSHDELNGLPVRGTAAPVEEDSDALPTRDVAAPVEEDSDETGDDALTAMPGETTYAEAEESTDLPTRNVELPIEAADTTAADDSWPLAKLDPLPQREVSAMEAAQRDTDQDDAAADESASSESEVETESTSEMEAPTIAPLPTSPDASDAGASSFGGLPTRMPQATIETVETGPTVLPLDIEESADAASADPESSSVSFGHFAKGVEAGLGDMSSNQGEDS